MKTMDKVMDVLLFVSIVALAIYFLFFHKPQSTSIEYRVIRDTIYADTVYIPVDNPVPTPPDTFYDVMFVEVPAKVDTAEILKKYFAVYSYRDTIRQDSMFSLILDDVVSQNKIIDRKAWYKDLSPTIINTTITGVERKSEYFIGGGR